MMAATPMSSSIPQAAARSPNARCRARSGSTAASRASSSASMSAAEPRYRTEILLGLPATHPISRRYQYGFPLIIFLYRLAMSLGHRIFARSNQGDTPDWRRPGPIPGGRQPIKINLSRKLGLDAVARHVNMLTEIIRGPVRRRARRRVRGGRRKLRMTGHGPADPDRPGGPRLPPVRVKASWLGSPRRPRRQRHAAP